MPESLSGRPYLTCAEAATYCGFKTIGGIQQAVRRGKLKPAGRRGGTGTYVFAREDLDAFLTGGLQPHERLFVPPEWSEAAAQGALLDITARPARRARGQAAPLSGQGQHPGPLQVPGHLQSAGLDRDHSPREMPIHGAAARPKPLPRTRDAGEKGAAEGPAKGKGRGRSKADLDAADPVSRIVAALAGPTRKSEQKQAPGDLPAASAKKQAKLNTKEKARAAK